MKHVLSSYANHYGGDLLLDNEADTRPKDNRFEELIFPLQSTSLRKVTSNNSFSNSLDAEETISKFGGREGGEVVASSEEASDRKKEDSK